MGSPSSSRHMWTWSVKNMQIWCMIFSEMAACPSRCFFHVFSAKMIQVKPVPSKKCLLVGQNAVVFSYLSVLQPSANCIFMFFHSLVVIRCKVPFLVSVQVEIQPNQHAAHLSWCLLAFCSIMSHGRLPISFRDSDTGAETGTWLVTVY